MPNTSMLLWHCIAMKHDLLQLFLYIWKPLTQVHGRDKHGDEDDERQLMDENPVIVLMEYGKLMGFRLMDLFAAFDKNGSKTLDRVEIETGLRVCIPPYFLNQLVCSLIDVIMYIDSIKLSET